MATILELVLEHSVAVAIGGVGAFLGAGFVWVRRNLPAAEDKRLRGVLRAFLRDHGASLRAIGDAADFEPSFQLRGHMVRASLVVRDEVVSGLRPKDRSRHFRSWPQIRRAFIEALDERGLEMPWVPMSEPIAEVFSERPVGDTLD